MDKKTWSILPNIDGFTLRRGQPRVLVKIGRIGVGQVWKLVFEIRVYGLVEAVQTKKRWRCNCGAHGLGYEVGLGIRYKRSFVQFMGELQRVSDPSRIT